MPAAARGESASEGTSFAAGARATSCAEGIAAEIFAACAGGAVLTAWALHLGATPLVIGVLGALPLAAQVLQVPAACLTERLGPKALAVAAVGASRLVWVPLALLPALSLSAPAALGLLVAVVALHAVLAVVGNNAWTAWMGDLVPASVRGRFFGRRTAWITAGGVVASLGAGVVLDGPGRDRPDLALSGLAAAALAAGLVSLALLAHQHGPRVLGPARGPASAMLVPFADRRVRPYLAYLVAWNAAVGLSASFYSFHMLAYLGTGFVLAALHGVGVALVRIATAPLGGAAVDRHRAEPVLALTSAGIALVPVAWFLAAPASLWILAVDAVLAGALWAGHGIASLDLALDRAPAAARPYYLGAFAAAGGAGFGLASVAAGPGAAWPPACARSRAARPCCSSPPAAGARPPDRSASRTSAPTRTT